MRRVIRGAFLALVMGLLVAFLSILNPFAAVAAPPAPPGTNLDSYVLFALQDLLFKGGGGTLATGGMIVGGNIGVNNVGGTLEYSTDNKAIMSSGTWAVADSASSGPQTGGSLYWLYANSVNPAWIAGNGATVQQQNPATVPPVGVGQYPWTPPLVAVPPPLPFVPTFQRMAAEPDLTVGGSGGQPSPYNWVPGNYRDVELQGNGTVVNLTDGVYNMRSLKVSTANPGVTINVRDGTIMQIDQFFDAGDRMRFGANPESHGCARVYVGSIKDATNAFYDPSTTRTTNWGHAGRISGGSLHMQYYAPNGWLDLGGDMELYGRYWAYRISGDPGNNVYLQCIPTTIVTQLSPPGPVMHGQSVQDTITISTDVNGALPTAGGTWRLEASRDISFGSGIFLVQSGPVSGNLPFIVVTNLWIPFTSGTWYLRATYSGDTYYSGSQSEPADETLVVDPNPSDHPTDIATMLDPPGPITLGQTVQDTITITTPDVGVLPAAGGIWAVQASQDAGFGSGVFLVDLGIVSGNLPFVATTSPWAPPFIGTWYLRATYSGDANYDGSQSEPVDEALTVDPPELLLTQACSASSRECGCFLGYLGRGPSAIGAVPGVLCIQPGGPDWPNFIAAARDGVAYTVKNTTLVKRTRSFIQCSDVFPPRTVIQQGTPNIRLRWPLMYETPGTTFTLTILYGTPAFYDDDGPGPNQPGYAHVAQWTQTVQVSLNSLGTLLALFHELPFGLDEVPLISDETLYPVLQGKITAAAAALAAGDTATAASILADFELEVTDACISSSPAFPNPAGPGTGIANTNENPACCKLLVDVEYILQNSGVGMPVK